MPNYSLFECHGIELEYIIVDTKTLDVKPVSDEIIKAASGATQTDFENGPISWANELVKHVLEVRTEEPVRMLDHAADEFQKNIATINKIAAPLGARLMPTSMHPWMDPAKQAVLWDHEYSDIFSTFDRLFNCRRHGWANIQSCQLNLPFGNDEEFGRLHAAIRLILPLIPALASSSPIVQMKLTGAVNNRLLYYQSDFSRPSNMAARCIPEQVFSINDYQHKILKPLYTELDTYPGTALLQHEWVNARGAILRTSRNAIEIRLMDMQEYPGADVAICRIITDALKNLVHETHLSYASQKEWTVEDLKFILDSIIQNGEKTSITNKAYLSCFGFIQEKATAEELWHHIIDTNKKVNTPAEKRDYDIVKNILKEGILSRRIKKSLKEMNPNSVKSTYLKLMDSLAQGKMFHAED